MGDWWRSPPGAYLLGWEQSLLDQVVTDLFGYHALQLGLPQLEGLRANRMPHRWLALDGMGEPHMVAGSNIGHARSRMPNAQHMPHMPHMPTTQSGLALRCDFDALPFPNQSLDLVVLPHALELARDPHDTLREVERVLMPEGRVLILGLNPASLWGLRQRVGHLRQRLGLPGQLFLPDAGEFIGYWRVRDWLRLLGFEVERARFGCWRPPVAAGRWLDRLTWMDPLGARVLPVLGAVYAVEAVKRVRGARLLGLARGRQFSKARAPAAVANRNSQLLSVRDRADLMTADNERGAALMEQD